tara:strand:+ start:180 stop:557 length:378 start_codon:yes stop_codon:yes gene_type:complete
LPKLTTTHTLKTGGLHRTLTIIAAYKIKIDQIDAQLADLTAREKLSMRKRDTRRKVIMGALAGYHMRKNPRSSFAKKLAALIDEYVIGDRERSLFDLDPLPKDEQENRKAAHKDENREMGLNQKT